VPARTATPWGGENGGVPAVEFQHLFGAHGPDIVAAALRALMLVADPNLLSRHGSNPPRAAPRHRSAARRAPVRDEVPEPTTDRPSGYGRPKPSWAERDARRQRTMAATWIVFQRIRSR